MELAKQVELTKEILAHIEAKTTALADEVTRNPVATYTDPEVLRRESEVLFRGYPLLVGFSGQLRETGDYLTNDQTGVPIVAVRDESGGIGAFMNVCRHRGAKVVDGCGHTGRRMVCPYHAWNYDLSGKLASLPHRQAFGRIDTEEYGLRPLPAFEKDGLVWVCPTPGRQFDIDDHLAGLGPELAAYGLEGYHHYETRTIQRRMNWKLVIDTFLEPYHFAFLHTDTVGPIFVPNLCLFEAFGLNLRETLPRRSIVDLKELPESEWNLITHSAIVYVLFPNTVLVMQADHVETWRVYPLNGAVDACVMSIDFLIPEPAATESARRHWERNMDLLIRTVVDEDFVASEGMQAGFASGAQEHVVYGRNEPALAHFQNSVKAALD
jgi:nitrite reductase/ring-hydroxylating ferredoxin subunit